MRRHRHALAALLVRECAYPWPETDPEVCEAIDFLECFALQTVAIESGPPLGQVPGERNGMRYHDRGLAAVIAHGSFR
jgi:RHH-type proline utilization regulon transcriptional repressor/proline dehydrogenase/delta 1-pyrroline-5-carboxylate dehydrogenase